MHLPTGLPGNSTIHLRRDSSPKLTAARIFGRRCKISKWSTFGAGMLIAAMAFVAIDHHANSGGFTRTVLPILRNHSYTDVLDVVTSPLSALVAWATLGTMGITAAIKKVRGE